MRSRSESVSEASSNEASKTRKRKSTPMNVFSEGMHKLLEKCLQKHEDAGRGLDKFAKKPFDCLERVYADYFTKMTDTFTQYQASEEYINVEMMRYSREMIATIQAVEDTVRYSRAFLLRRHGEVAAQEYSQAIDDFANLRITAEDQLKEMVEVQESVSDSQEDVDDE